MLTVGDDNFQQAARNRLPPEILATDIAKCGVILSKAGLAIVDAVLTGNREALDAALGLAASAIEAAHELTEQGDQL